MYFIRHIFFFLLLNYAIKSHHVCNWNETKSDIRFNIYNYNYNNSYIIRILLIHVKKYDYHQRN